ncbi:MAG TPA: hypothetical protein VLA54_13715 [Acidimicrobiia bacterium]|nr:hypothetical protein [Acidimicrobiia bacterium]
MYPLALQAIAAGSVLDLFRDFEGAAPHTSQRLRSWLKTWFGPEPLEKVFTRPDAFPLLLLPWWLEASVRGSDLSMQRELTTSSISGYLYIRLIDNLMDRDAPADVAMLPALSLLHTRFTDPFRKWFGPQHPFWAEFHNIWFETAEVTLLDSTLDSIDRSQFETISARKTGAAKIPVAATAHAIDRSDLLPDWCQFIDRFGCWHQMTNDLFGWHKDLRNQNTTYLLSEGQTAVAESIESWFYRKGFDWAIQQLDGWMDELRVLGDRMGSPDLLSYLDTRHALLHDQAARVRGGLEAVTDLGRIVTLGQGRPSPGERGPIE